MPVISRKAYDFFLTKCTNVRRQIQPELLSSHYTIADIVWVQIEGLEKFQTNSMSQLVHREGSVCFFLPFESQLWWIGLFSPHHPYPHVPDINPPLFFYVLHSFHPLDLKLKVFPRLWSPFHHLSLFSYNPAGIYSYPSLPLYHLAFCSTAHSSPVPSYLLGGDSGSLPPWPPAFHHGNEAGQHHSGCQYAEHAGEAVDIQGAATLSCLDWAVQVTGAVLGPPFEFQYIHISILLKLQDSRKWACTQRHTQIRVSIHPFTDAHTEPGTKCRNYHVCSEVRLQIEQLLYSIMGKRKAGTHEWATN